MMDIWIFLDIEMDIEMESNGKAIWDDFGSESIPQITGFFHVFFLFCGVNLPRFHEASHAASGRLAGYAMPSCALL
jgi:hypothetical protein